MRAIIKGTTNNIDNLEDALKFCQDSARFCYSDKNLEDIESEPYNPRLTEDVLIKLKHHSPLEHFTINYMLEDIPKALVMVLNNQRFISTTEKSARYTFIPESLVTEQKEKYMKWYDWFNKAIPKEYPETSFPRLYKKDSTGKTPVQKLSQENARYMGSVFVPTRLIHKLDLSHLNKIVYAFNEFSKENIDSPDFFKKNLAVHIQDFVKMPDIKKFTYENGFSQKAGLGLNLFGEENKDIFDKDVYSTNDTASFAALAQRHRHRTIDHHLIDGYQLRAPLGFFIPPLVSEYFLQNDWMNDLNQISQTDISQAQLVYFGFSGNTRELPMMTSERICNNAQLETNFGIRKFLHEYSKHVPEIKELMIPDCQKTGCNRGGCYLGSSEYLIRKI
jgi:thymidylate synthase ThyX